jgi:microcystin degradation protein MlrC
MSVTIQAAGYEIIPTVCARAVPNGEVSLSLYKKLKKEIMFRAHEALKSGQVDALCLSLHGSMRIQNLGEAEGDLLESLRDIFPDKPIQLALDMHTSFSQKMFQYSDGCVGYKCAPHTDCYETGVHAAQMILDCLEMGYTPVSSWI